MKQYRLKKELPGCGEGMVFKKCTTLQTHILFSFYSDEFYRIFIHKDIVENNPDTFEEIK